MWRYIFMAVSVMSAATMYPALFQEKVDEIKSERAEVRVTDGRVPQQMAAVDEKSANNPLSGRTAKIAPDDRGHFIARAKMNGRSLEVLVDTGATLVAINESTARKLGIKLSKEDFIHRVNTANGALMAAAAMIDEIQIGRVIVRDVQATVTPDKALSTVLLGMSFLNKLKKFEVSGGTLVLVQ